MKILFFIGSLGAGGAERVTAILGNHWAAKGWDVDIVTLAGLDRDFYPLDPRIRRTPLDLERPSRHAVDAALNNFRRIAALRRILLAERPDVAIGMMPASNVTLAIAGRNTGVRLVGSERNFPPCQPLGRVWEFVRRHCYPLLDAMVAQTTETARWLQAHAPSRQIIVIPNPLQYPLMEHPPHVDPVGVTRALPGNRVLLAVGRLEELKGFDRLITGFASVANRHPDWSLVILGEGPAREHLEQQAADLGVATRVAMPGAIGNIAEWYGAADCFVLTSLTEGFPNALVEALACGLPAVAVDCKTGPSEILGEDEEDGVLVPQDDPAALAIALDRVMDDADLRARLSAGATGVRERFSVERIARRWEAMFADV